MNRADRRRKEKLVKKLNKAVNPVEQAKTYFSKGCKLVSKGQFNVASTHFKRASQTNPEYTPDLSCFAEYIETQNSNIPLSTCITMLSPLQHILKTNSIRISIPPVLIRTLSSHSLDLHLDGKFSKYVFDDFKRKNVIENSNVDDTNRSVENT